MQDAMKSKESLYCISTTFVQELRSFPGLKLYLSEPLRIAAMQQGPARSQIF
jgi:hypothetical protein